MVVGTNPLWGRCFGTVLLLLVIGKSAAAAEVAAAEIAEAEVAEATVVTSELPAEIPEEILRTEIITEARSPLTGKPLSAVDYAQLQAELAAPAGGNLLNDDLRRLLFLLQLRHAVKPILPFF